MRLVYRILLGLITGGIIWVILLVLNQILLAIFHRSELQIPVIYWIYLCLISFISGFLISFSLIKPSEPSITVIKSEEPDLDPTACLNTNLSDGFSPQETLSERNQRSK